VELLSGVSGAAKGRPAWLRVDRLAGEHGVGEDTAEGRIEFQQPMEQQRSEGECPEMLTALRRGWRLGAAGFLQRLSEKPGRRGKARELAHQREETDLERGRASRSGRDDAVELATDGTDDTDGTARGGPFLRCDGVSRK
jgi:hypothetical protein